MGLKKKPNREGATRLFITRTQAIKRLQVSLKDFQRLCILKGVYPTDIGRGNTLTSKGINRKRIRKDKVYYHLSDVRLLAHGDLLSKFREIKSYLRRYTKLVSKREFFDAKLVKENRPTYSLTSVVKQRCPSLVIALGELDDALSTIAAIAALPSERRRGVRPEIVSQCGKHLGHFLFYVAETRCLKRCFISVKGFYFQTEVLGVSSTFLLPHQFGQTLPATVDFPVIMTFAEYYLALLRLVNFKLFSLAGLPYPPPVKRGQETLSSDFTIYQSGRYPGDKNNMSSFGDKNNMSSFGDKNNMSSFGGKNNMSSFGDKSDRGLVGGKIDRGLVDEKTDRGLFEGLAFFVSSEVPLTPTALVIRGGGGVLGVGVGVTHWVTDRPGEVDPNVECVQPQYVFDCFNAGVLLPTAPYRVGAKLPHHLSPFESDEGYVPERRRELERMIEESMGDGKGEGSGEEGSLAAEVSQAREMQRALLPRRKRRLLDKIEFAKKRREKEVSKLEQRKREYKKTLKQ